MKIKHRIQLVTALLPALNLPMKAAEVGVAEGRFSHDLLEAGLDVLYMVDNWSTIAGQRGDGGFPQNWHDSNFSQAQKATEPWANKRIILEGMSTKMAAAVPDNYLGLVYLDADHSYHGVARDLSAWYPKLVKGGIMAGHDYLNTAYGVWPAVWSFVNGLNAMGAGITIEIIPEDLNPDNASFYFIKS